MSGDLRRIMREYHGDTDQVLAEIDMRCTVKIRRAGNAEAVTIPRKWLQKLGWKEGDSVRLHLDKRRDTITLEKLRLKEDPKNK